MDDPIRKVESEIEKTEKQIDSLEKAMMETSEASEKNVLREEKSLLRKKELQLREEKLQLREEKLIIMRKSGDRDAIDPVTVALRSLLDSQRSLLDSQQRTNELLSVFAGCMSPPMSGVETPIAFPESKACGGQIADLPEAPVLNWPEYKLYGRQLKRHYYKELKSRAMALPRTRERFVIGHNHGFIYIKDGLKSVFKCPLDGHFPRNLYLELFSVGFSLEEWLTKKEGGEFGEMDHENLCSPPYFSQMK